MVGRSSLYCSSLCTLLLLSLNIARHGVSASGSGYLRFRDDAQCSHGSSSNDSKTSPYFLVLAPYPDAIPFNPSWRGGPAIVPAALVAKQLINNRSDILGDYRIEFIIHDSGCNQTSKAVNGFIRSLFYSNKSVVGIIGGACSEATRAIAPLVPDERVSLIQIAPSATSPDFTNTTHYPNTFRPIVSALGVVDTYIEIIRRMNYRHVGALFEADRPFQTTVYTRFRDKVLKQGIRLTAFGLSNGHFPLREFRAKLRVIFVFASSGLASQVLCLAFHEGMLYPQYQFIFSNRRPKNFLRTVDVTLDGITCSRTNMGRTVVGMVFNDFRLTRRDRNDQNTDAGVSYDEFDKIYTKVRSCHIESLGLKESDIVSTEHHSGYFDSTWALALALNNSLSHIEEKGLSLSNYMYKMPEITKIVKEELLSLCFEGMRGRVKFSRETHDGANVTLIDVYQVFNVGSDADIDIVGFYNPNPGSLEPALVLYDNASLIPAEFDLVYVTPHVSLGVITVIFVVVLFVALFACQIANVVWGTRKSVKATSPNLNHLIFSGCYLSLIGAIVYTNAFVFINVSDNINLVIPIYCSALQWTSTMTFSLVIGTLGAKTWRIYRIFNRFSASPMKRLGDSVLIVIALIPLLVDAVLNILWNLIDPWYLSIVQGPDQSAEATCQTDNQIVWTICIAVPKAVLTFVVLYLSIATRRVHRREFRQTKVINVLIYSLLIITGVLLPLFFILQSTVTLWAVSLRYLIFCLFDLAYVALCVALVLLPPLLPHIKGKVQNLQTRLICPSLRPTTFTRR